MISDLISEEEIAEACYTFVCADLYFHKLWPWHLLIQHLPKLTSDKAKWLAIEAIGNVCGLGKSNKTRIYSCVSSDSFVEKHAVDYLHEVSMRAKLIGQSNGKGSVAQNDELFCLIEGVLLPKHREDEILPTINFVNLSGRLQTLRDIALGIANRQHTLLTVS